MLNRVNDISPYMGCDPEFFFRKDGEIVGAETMLAPSGLDVGNGSRFIIDGVQAELNPAPSFCRANLANNIRVCFSTLIKEMAKHKGFTADFSTTVEISKENLAQLNEAAKRFGCAPSQSIYKKVGVNIAGIDPIKYRKRAAGGHIHIGMDEYKSFGLKRALKEDYAKVVQMLDIICGNTCVLIDRDEGNIERRKLYGRAGEYRLPEHGIEYRTLSNFWLTSYPLLSMAFGLARLAVQLIADKNYVVLYNEFISASNLANVHKAINNNDFDLAMENFKNVEKLIMEVSNTGDRYTVTSANIKEFHHFVYKIKSDGLKYWFKDEPLKHWTSIRECHAGGFHDYLLNVVQPDMLKDNKSLQTKAATKVA